MTIQNAFFKVCSEAEIPESNFVSLYRKEQFYGGPEEGGWYGTDTVLVASQRYDTREAAEAAKAAVSKLAEVLTTEAKQAFNERCRAECDWLEQRGLDDDFLPEPDGECSYFVRVESVSGESEYEACRHYE